MAPFGFGNPAPMLAILGAEVAGAPVVMKEKHLRVHLRQGGRSLSPRPGILPSASRISR